MTAGIFISYRRQDAIKDARSVFERLGREFGPRNVFMDLEGLAYGEDFVEALERHLAHCVVMLVLIGPRWLAMTDAQGRRRLDDPDDFVRIELRTALARPGVRVVPVLLDGAELPLAAELPGDLRALRRRQMFTLRDTAFDADMRQLCANLRPVLAAAEAGQQPQSPTLRQHGFGIEPQPAEEASVLQAMPQRRPPDHDRPVPEAVSQVSPAPPADVPTPTPVPTAAQQQASRRVLLGGGVAVAAAGLFGWYKARPHDDAPAPAPAPAPTSASAPTPAPAPARAARPQPMTQPAMAARPAWASADGRDEFGHWAEFEVGDAVQRLRWIEPGEFVMGSPNNEPERDADEGPQHPVRLTAGFWLADTACTQALWLAVLGGQNPAQFQDDPQNPVEQVSHVDAERFLSALQRRLNGRPQAVLPTEAQWEYACRAGTTTPFSFGPTITPQQVNYDGRSPYAGGAKGQFRNRTVPVKALPANRWGLYQMHGNVWEWCADGLRHYAGGTAAAAIENPVGPQEQGTESRRVIRGGGWLYDARYVRSACRNQDPRGLRSHYLGFRLALRS